MLARVCFLVVVCAANAPARAEPSSELALGATIPLTRAAASDPSTEPWHTGYKITARHETDRCAARCTIGVEWSGWHGPNAVFPDDDSFHRLALLAGVAPRLIRGDLSLSVRAALGLEVVWGASTTHQFIPPGPDYRAEHRHLGLAGNLGAGAAWRAGPVDLGITAALAMSVHGTHPGNDSDDGYLHYNALGLDILLTVALRK